ncbi:hypothetical protein HKX48_003904 [Thoreauomyces humboldtii]|nr:hypothetical protein HKX48_003904 [Thoreauomyces humboldtii]
MHALLCSQPPAVAKSRVTAALRWRVESGLKLDLHDFICLAGVTSDERGLAVDVTEFLEDAEAYLGRSPKRALFVRALYGLAVVGGYMEVKSLISPKWKADDYRATLRGMASHWRRREPYYQTLSLDQQLRLESNVGLSMHQILVCFIQTFGKQEATTHLYNSYAAILQGSIRSFSDAEGFMIRMARDGFQPNMDTFNILICHLISNGKTDAATELLKMAQHRRLEPNDGTLDNRIRLLLRKNNTREVLQVWKQLSPGRQGRLAEDDPTLASALICAFSEWNQPEIALALADVLSSAENMPSDRANMLLIRVLTARRDPTELELALGHYRRIRSILVTLPLKCIAHLRSNGEHPLSCELHSFLVSECLLSNREEAALDVYRGMEAIGVAPDLFTFTPLVSHFNKRGQPGRVSELFAHMARLGIRPDLALYYVVVKDLLRKNQAGQVAAIVRDIKARAMPVDSVFLELLTRNGHMDLAKSLLLEPIKGEDPSIAQNNRILAEHVRQGRMQKARILWDQMVAMVAVDRESYHIALPMFITTGDGAVADNLFEELARAAGNRMRSNEYTYGLMMLGNLRAGKKHRAMDYYERLLSSRVSLTIATFQPLISFFCANADFERAERCLGDAIRILPAHRVESQLYTPILYGYARLTRSEGRLGVQRVVAKLRAINSAMDGAGLGAVITAFTILRQFAAAQPYIEQARASPGDDGPDRHAVLQAVLNWYAKQGHKEMEKVVAQMISGTWGSSPEPHLDGPLLDLMTSSAEYGPPGKLSPTIALYSILLEGYDRAGDWRKALGLYRHLRSHPGTVSASHHAAPSADHDVLRNFGVSHVTVSVILDALGRHHQLELLEETWRDIRQSGFPLDTNNWTSYLEGLACCDCVANAIRILEDPPEGFVPDVKTLRNVLGLAPHGSARQSVQALIDTKYPSLAPEVRSSSHLTWRPVPKAGDRKA